MNKKWFPSWSVLLIIFLLLSVMALGGCETVDPPVDDDENGVPDTPDPDPDPDPEPELKTLTVGLVQAPPSFDPMNHRNRIAQTIVRNWTEALVQVLPDGTHVLDLAESITEIDEVTFEIKLREDVTFHNGDPLTADDLVFSIKRFTFEGAMEGETSPRATLLRDVESVEKIDDYTVIVTMSRFFDMSRRWYHYEVIPKNYFEEVGVDGFLENPIGLGPFKWVEGDISSHLVLERYENYYGGAKDLPGEVDQIPALDRVIFRFIPEATTRVSALLAGDLDIIQGVPTDSIELLQNHPETRIVGTAGTNVVKLVFNTNKEPFNDKRVRKAVAYAIDYDSMIEYQLLGQADALKGVTLLNPYQGEPGHGKYDDIIQNPPFDYDLEKAKALMEEAQIGEITAVIDTTMEFNEQAQAIAQMLNEIDIQASVRVWDASVITEELRKGERDLYLTRLGVGSKPPWGIIGSYTTDAPLNHMSFSNSDVDHLYEKGVGMELDNPERDEVFRELNFIVMEELPALTLYVPRVVEACRANVINFYPSAVGRVNLHRVDIE